MSETQDHNRDEDIAIKTPKRGRGRPRVVTSELAGLLPKKPIGRPKGSKNKHPRVPKAEKIKLKTYNEVKLIVPALPLFWRAKKQLWLIRNIEEHLKKDPSYISPKEYFHLLKEQESMYNQLIKDGLETNEKRKARRFGIHQKRLVEDGKFVPTAGDGETERSGVGDGVPAVNPFRKQG